MFVYSTKTFINSFLPLNTCFRAIEKGKILQPFTTNKKSKIKCFNNYSIISVVTTLLYMVQYLSIVLNITAHIQGVH